MIPPAGKPGARETTGNKALGGPSGAGNAGRRLARRLADPGAKYLSGF